MVVLNNRYLSNKNGTLGIIVIDGVHYGYWLENRPRVVKVKGGKSIGDTCIFAGDYELKFRKAESSLTLKYRKRFDFFTYHLEVQNTEKFGHVYCHIGNPANTKDTSACKMGFSINCNVKAIKNPANAQYFLGDNIACFQIVYPIIANALENNKKVMFKVRDIS